VARRSGHLPAVEATILRQTDNDKHALNPAATWRKPWLSRAAHGQPSPCRCNGHVDVDLTGWTQGAASSLGLRPIVTRPRPCHRERITPQLRAGSGEGHIRPRLNHHSRWFRDLDLVAVLSFFRGNAKTIVSATALTMDDIARYSLDRVDGVLATVVGRVEKKWHRQYQL